MMKKINKNKKRMTKKFDKNDPDQEEKKVEEEFDTISNSTKK